jgi:Photosynthetic reaction centre cytochrome C subunit
MPAPLSRPILARWYRAAILVATGVITAPAAAQIPDSFTNLQVLPRTISRDSLVDVMRRFSLSLGVRCEHCHVGQEGNSLAHFQFEKDDSAAKRKARFMMRMVETLNRYVLPMVPDRGEPAVVVECKTCHRGWPRPVLLGQEMRWALEAKGVDSAIARYRELKQNFENRGVFDFGQWEVNLFAEQLAREGRTQDAIAIYLLNRESFPNSVGIAFALGQLYETRGDTTGAVREYRRTLELAPDHKAALGRLRALGAASR